MTTNNILTTNTDDTHTFPVYTMLIFTVICFTCTQKLTGSWLTVHCVTKTHD